MSDRIALRIGATDYTGWKGIDVRIGIEQMAGCFELRCADRWAIRGQPLPALPGSAISVRIAGHPVITGWIDDVGVRYSGRDHTLTIRGRDTTGDFIDSAAITDGGSWANSSLQQIVSALAEPLAIPVHVDADAAADAALPFKFSQLQIGESRFDACSRLARMRGLLLVSDGVGGLKIVRAGKTRASTRLVRGQNILSADVEISHIERFNVYRVVAQARETQELNGVAAQQLLAEVVDPQIRKGRITILEAAGSMDQADANRLANWARSTRAAAGERGNFRTRGWLDGSTPWLPNRIVSIQDDWTRFVGDFLISTVRFTIDDEGELTEISVTPPNAFAPLLLKEQSPTSASSYSAQLDAKTGSQTASQLDR